MRKACYYTPDVISDRIASWSPEHYAKVSETYNTTQGTLPTRGSPLFIVSAAGQEPVGFARRRVADFQAQDHPFGQWGVFVMINCPGTPRPEIQQRIEEKQAVFEAARQGVGHLAVATVALPSPRTISEIRSLADDTMLLHLHETNQSPDTIMTHGDFDTGLPPDYISGMSDPDRIPDTPLWGADVAYETVGDPDAFLNKVLAFAIGTQKKTMQEVGGSLLYEQGLTMRAGTYALAGSWGTAERGEALRLALELKRELTWPDEFEWRTAQRAHRGIDSICITTSPRRSMPALALMAGVGFEANREARQFTTKQFDPRRSFDPDDPQSDLVRLASRQFTPQEARSIYERQEALAMVNIDTFGRHRMISPAGICAVRNSMMSARSAFAMERLV